MESLESKRLALEAQLKGLDKVAVAYSGGVDSAFLAYAAYQALGNRMLAVIADSPSLARSQYDDALRFAREQGIPLRVIETAELESPEYARNGADRCFHCKDELFTVMERIRAEEGYAAVAYGKNTDDNGDFRPGQRAAELHHVVAPLAEAGLGKAEVRELARCAGLRLWSRGLKTRCAGSVFASSGCATTAKSHALKSRARRCLLFSPMVWLTGLRVRSKRPASALWRSISKATAPVQ